MRSGKASGVCGIQGELLKAGGKIIVKWLQKSCNLVWRTGLAPVVWRRLSLYQYTNRVARKCANLKLPGKQLAKHTR